MGLLSKIKTLFSKNDKIELQIEELTYDKAQERITKIKKELEKETIERLDKHGHELEKHFQGMQEQIRKIEFSDKTHPKIQAKVKSAAKTFNTHLDKLLITLKEKPKKISEIVAYHNQLTKNTVLTVRDLSAYLQAVATVSKLEYPEKTFSEIKTLNNQLQDYFEEKKETIHAIVQLDNAEKSKQQLTKELKTITKKIEQKEGKRKEKRKIIGKLETEIHLLKKNRDYKRYFEIKEKVEELKKQLLAAKNTIQLEITTLERGLKKLENTLTDKTEIRLLHDYVEDPLTALQKDGTDYPQLKELLKKLLKALNEDKLDLKDRQTIKYSLHAEKLLTSDGLTAKTIQLHDLEREYKLFTSQVDDTPIKMEKQLQTDLQKVQKELEKITIEETQKEKQVLEEKIKETQQKIFKSLEKATNTLIKAEILEH